MTHEISPPLIIWSVSRASDLNISWIYTPFNQSSRAPPDNGHKRITGEIIIIMCSEISWNQWYNMNSLLEFWISCEMLFFVEICSLKMMLCGNKLSAFRPFLIIKVIEFNLMTNTFWIAHGNSAVVFCEENYWNVWNKFNCPRLKLQMNSISFHV